MRDLLVSLRLSISTRLTLWYGLSLLLLLSVFVIFLYTSFHVSLHHDFERQLQRDETRLQEAVRIAHGEPVLQEDEALHSVAIQTDGVAGAYVRLLSASGEVLYSSPNFGGHARFIPSPPDEVAPVVVGRTWQRTPARSRYAPLTDTRGQHVGWLEVTRLESALHDELHRLRWLLALGILLGAALAIGSGYGLARRALRPVAAITGAAQEIQADALGQRIPEEFGVRDELTDLAETLNALLERLDASFERERRFRADAAHEMFTPISALQSEIDVALMRPRAPGYYQETLSTLRGHVRRLADLVEGLLLLSRAEAGDHAEGKQTDVSAVAQDLLRRFRAVADTRGVRLAGELSPGVHAAADPAHLEAVTDILLDNAIKYTPPDGTVTVSTCVEGSDAVLRVRDTGIGFSDAEASRLFDRFYRADAQQVQQSRGSGLGLSIAKAIVEVYGGEITSRSSGRDHGSTFEVHLPLAEEGNEMVVVKC